MFSVSQPQIIGEPMMGTTGQGGEVRISLSAPAEEGITVRFCVHEGSIILYASIIIPNPSSAINDWSREIPAHQDLHTLVCYTRFSNISSDNSTVSQNVSLGISTDSTIVTLYIAIEGQDNFNEFSLNSSQGEVNFGKIMILSAHEYIIKKNTKNNKVP